MIYIAPSLLAADYANLAHDIKKVDEAGAQYLHLDIMDGMFVPNMSFGAPVIASIRKASDIVFDVHLMITEHQRYIDDFVKAGSDIITIHYESCDDPHAVIRSIREKGVKAAISLKPATPAEAIFPMLPDLDMVLVMTVEPGFGGQKMMPDMLDKVRAIRAYADANGFESLDIEVDGGITAENVSLMTEAGANIVVAGSAIFKPNYAEVIAKMKEEAAAHPYKA